MSIERLEIGDFFSIWLPKGTAVDFENDDTLAVFTLSDATRLFAGVYSAPFNSGSDFALSELKRFMEDCAGRTGLVDYAEATNSNAETVIYQAVSELENGKWMIARTILKKHSENLLVLHWCGDGNAIKLVVLPALLSVELNY